MQSRLDPKLFNSIYPIVGIDVYKGGLVIRRANGEMTKPNKPIPQRGKILELSKRSLNNLAFTAQCTSVAFYSLMTLTYGLEYPSCGKTLKRALNALIIQTRRHFGWYEYLWFLEFQKRGAPHIHMLTTLPKPGEAERFEFAQLWVRIVLGRGTRLYSLLRDKSQRSLANDMLRVHAHRDSWDVIKVKDGARRYVLKYATKPYQKIVPEEFADVGRFWACSRAVRVEPKQAIAVACDDTTLRRVLWLVGRVELSHWDILPRQIFVPRSLYDQILASQKPDS